MQLLHTNSFTLNTAIRTVKFNGRDHIIAPVILLTEGVHNGSSGPLFYSSEEIQKTAHLWNGVPIPIYHPVDKATGSPISCNSPDVIQEQGIGNLWNVAWDDTGKKLRGEVYIDVAKANQVNPVVMEYLTTNKPLEVSTGLFSTDQTINGTWNDKKYTAVVTNIMPDHLALLPGQKGACSWSDGCGIRANAEGKSMGEENLFKRFISKVVDLVSNSTCITDNAGISLDERRRAVADALRENNKNSDIYIVELFDDHVIYEQMNTSTIPAPPEIKNYSCDYEADKDNNITFGTPQEVIRKVTYVPVVNEEGIVDNTKKVKYADPDGKKYPIDTEEHVRAALSYWGMPKNKAFYSEEDQKKITSKIEAAAKKFGIKLSDQKNNADPKIIAATEARNLFVNAKK